MPTRDKWNREKQAVKAVQVAFDLEQELSHRIRFEALERGINPSDRIREILGLPINTKPIRPRLSISLTQEDFRLLARQFKVASNEQLKIRHIAAEVLLGRLGETPSLGGKSDTGYAP